jgi:hypothetical protein
LRALAYNLGNFMRTLAIPDAGAPWSLTNLRRKLIKFGAQVVSHGRYVTFQMAEVAAPRKMFQEILSLIARLRVRPHQRERVQDQMRRRLKCAFDEGKPAVATAARQATHSTGAAWHRYRGCRLSLHSPGSSHTWSRVLSEGTKALLSGKCARK